MTQKESLRRYRAFKTVRGNIEHYYVNTNCSRLLANARAGCLRTAKFWSRFGNGSSTCTKCENAEETIEHIVLECNSVGRQENEIQRKVGLHNTSNRGIVESTKRILEIWERRSLEEIALKTSTAQHHLYQQPEDQPSHSPLD